MNKLLKTLLLTIVVFGVILPVYAQEGEADNAGTNEFEEGSIQSCRDLRRQWVDECKTATTKEQIGKCNTGKICVKNGNEWVLEDAGVPYDNEFFDVLDPEQGLVAPGQIVDSSSRFTDSTGDRSLIGILYSVINFLAQMVSILALVVMVAGIFILITANGDDNQITKGKDAIKYSLVGLAFVMLSYTIVVLVQSIFY